MSTTDDDYVVSSLPPTDDQRRMVEATGGRMNPDTNNSMPGPSARQKALVAELLDAVTTASMGNIEELLTEAVVRQHGRTLRACIADLRDAADADNERAAYYARESVRNVPYLPVDYSKLQVAGEYAQRSRTLRGVMLRGRWA